MCRPAHAIYLAARSWTGNLPDRPNLCLSMPRLENPLRPGCADWQRQCRLKKLGNLRGNAFIFRRLLEGFRQEEARSHAQEKQSLKNLLKPLQSQLLPRTLLQKEIDAIADQVLESAPTELSVEQMRAELKEADFEQEIEDL